MSTCGLCGAQSDLYLCTHCTSAFSDTLYSVAITHETARGVVHCLLDELDVMLSRQTVRGDSSRTTHGDTQPLPFDMRASETRTDIENVVMTAYRLATSRRDARVVHGPRFAARLLVNDLSAFVSHSQCVDLARRLKAVTARALAVIDRPPDRWYAGQCSAMVGDVMCPTDLYAIPGATIVQCPTCATSHDVRQRREMLLTAAEDVLATATEIARAVNLFGEAVTAARIHVWRTRGRLAQHGTSNAGHPRYRLGDVLALEREHQARRARQQKQ